MARAMSPRAKELFGEALWVVSAVAAVGMLLALGRFVPTQPLLVAAVAIVVLVIGLTMAEPAVLPLLALPGLLVIARADTGGVDLSVSDLILAGAFFPALFLARRPFSEGMRTALWLSAIYQVATLFTVLANPYAANAVEWVHAYLLVSGSLLVGWIVGRQGFARTGVILILLTTLAIAVSTIVQGALQYVDGFYGPVYTQWPYSMHKNFTGTVFTFAAAIAYARPPWLRLGRAASLSLFWVYVAALLLAQSRQALVGLAAALVLISLRTDPERKRSKLIVLAVAPALAFVAVSVREQIASGNEFNSAFVRLTWLGDAIDVWQSSPWVGVGLRWWYTDRFDVKFQPPNAEVEVLTSAGVVGLIGFLALVVGTLVVAWRIDPRWGTVAAAVLLARLVQSQLDLFWVAAQSSIPFVILGLTLGAEAHRRGEEAPTIATELERVRVG